MRGALGTLRDVMNVVRKSLYLALVTVVLGVLIVGSGCGDKTATAQSSQPSSPAARATPDWSRVGMWRVLGMYLRPGHPSALEFQVSSSELQILVLTEKPLTGCVLYVRGPAPTESSDDTFTVVPMQTSTRSFGDLTSSISTVKSLTPGVYRLVLKGTGEVSTIEMKQR